MPYRLAGQPHQSGDDRAPDVVQYQVSQIHAVTGDQLCEKVRRDRPLAQLLQSAQGKPALTSAGSAHCARLARGILGDDLGIHVQRPAAVIHCQWCRRLGSIHGTDSQTTAGGQSQGLQG